METKTKTFDAIEMSRRLRREVSAMTALMTWEEELAFFNSVLTERREKVRARQESCVVREEPPEE